MSANFFLTLGQFGIIINFIEEKIKNSRIEKEQFPRAGPLPAGEKILSNPVG